MIYGVHPVLEALRAQRRHLRALYYREGSDAKTVERAIELAQGCGIAAYGLANEDLHRKSGSRQHQGLVLDCGELPKLALKEWLATAPAESTLVALDQIEDPQNTGGIARSAKFFGATALVLHRSRSAPLSAAATKASAGALESFPIVEVGNLAQALRSLKKEGFWIAGSAIGEKCRDYRRVDVPRPRVLVLGSEGSGLRRLTRERCDDLLYIPRQTEEAGGVDSLNVSAAAAVFLAHWA